MTAAPVLWDGKEGMNGIEADRVAEDRVGPVKSFRAFEPSST